MLEEKWQQLVGRIKDEFEVLEHTHQAGMDQTENKEEVVFVRDGGQFKLTRAVRPRVLGEKTIYSNRIGASTSIEKVYSDTETVDAVRLFRHESGEWVEVDVRALGE